MTRSGAEFWWKKPLPKHIAYLYHDGGYHWGGKIEWKEVTFKELLEKKIEKQKTRLEYKRRHERIVPCFIWVFCNTHSFPFGGWYIYIKTLKYDYGINFRHESNPLLVEKAMQIFPCGTIPIIENFVEWAENFSVAFKHVGFKRRKKQGLRKAFAKINKHGELVDLM